MPLPPPPLTNNNTLTYLLCTLVGTIC